MSRSGINSRVFTNSFAYRNDSAYSPYYLENYGDSFYNLTKAQYSYQTYGQLASSGAGAGSSGRAGRWARSNGQEPTAFNPPPGPNPGPDPNPEPDILSEIAFKNQSNVFIEPNTFTNGLTVTYGLSLYPQAIQDNYLSGNVALKNVANTFTETNNFNTRVNFNYVNDTISYQSTLSAADDGAFYIDNYNQTSGQFQRSIIFRTYNMASTAEFYKRCRISSEGLTLYNDNDAFNTILSQTTTNYLIENKYNSSEIILRNKDASGASVDYVFAYNGATFNNNLNQPGTGIISQTGTGINLLKDITLNANAILTQSGTGVITQTGTGTNTLKGTTFSGSSDYSNGTGINLYAIGDLYSSTIDQQGINNFFANNNDTGGIFIRVLDSTSNSLDYNFNWDYLSCPSKLYVYGGFFQLNSDGNVMTTQLYNEMNDFYIVNKKNPSTTDGGNIRIQNFNPSLGSVSETMTINHEYVNINYGAKITQYDSTQGVTTSLSQATTNSYLIENNYNSGDIVLRNKNASTGDVDYIFAYDGATLNNNVFIPNSYSLVLSNGAGNQTNIRQLTSTTCVIHNIVPSGSIILQVNDGSNEVVDAIDINSVNVICKRDFVVTQSKRLVIQDNEATQQQANIEQVTGNLLIKNLANPTVAGGDIYIDVTDNLGEYTRILDINYLGLTVSKGLTLSPGSTLTLPDNSISDTALSANVPLKDATNTIAGSPSSSVPDIGLYNCTANTQSSDDNSTYIATTAFVQDAISGVALLADDNVFTGSNTFTNSLTLQSNTNLPTTYVAPTINQLGWVVPGSVIIVTGGGIPLTLNGIDTIATFTNVPIGTYIFSANGTFNSFNTNLYQYWVLSFTSSNGLVIYSRNQINAVPTSSSASIGACSTTCILVNTSIASYVIKTYTSDSQSSPNFSDYSFSLVRIA